ncbi:DMT family transporter [Paeniglutamicibacter cryotolerans]|uniref:Small multidrug resistance pump n=1 Tax=Paeniglutamicibacter cryotolerans TaxID=670079 RepID=A0A839QM51_9MICC|nr:multidrug efflux SMR transporter [Paeniglutamicibacter cryotolerans]MBB2996840.1 small multidrug resistance pump [Paeniglutamicibacter cryotolerans]
MTKWLLLAVAILTEVTATLSLKAALEQPWWYMPVVFGYIAAFSCLALAMRRGLPLGVAYGIWGALGVALTAVLALFIFAEPLTPAMMLGLGIIIVGVVLVELGSQHAAKTASGAEADTIA